MFVIVHMSWIALAFGIVLMAMGGWLRNFGLVAIAMLWLVCAFWSTYIYVFFLFHAVLFITGVAFLVIFAIRIKKKLWGKSSGSSSPDF